MKTLPVPFAARGVFEFAGVELAQLACPLHTSELVAELAQLDAHQLEMFQGLQKSMERYKIPFGLF